MQNLGTLILNINESSLELVNVTEKQSQSEIVKGFISKNKLIFCNELTLILYKMLGTLLQQNVV